MITTTTAAQAQATRRGARRQTVPQCEVDDPEHPAQKVETAKRHLAEALCLAHGLKAGRRAEDQEAERQTATAGLRLRTNRDATTTAKTNASPLARTAKSMPHVLSHSGTADPKACWKSPDG